MFSSSHSHSHSHSPSSRLSSPLFTVTFTPLRMLLMVLIFCGIYLLSVENSFYTETAKAITAQRTMMRSGKQNCICADGGGDERNGNGDGEGGTQNTHTHTQTQTLTQAAESSPLVSSSSSSSSSSSGSGLLFSSLFSSSPSSSSRVDSLINYWFRSLSNGILYHNRLFTPETTIDWSDVGHSGQTLPQFRAYFNESLRLYLLQPERNHWYCETGFNLGHSAVAALMGNPNMQSLSFDIGWFKHTPEASRMITAIAGPRNIQYQQQNNIQTQPLDGDKNKKEDEAAAKATHFTIDQKRVHMVWGDSHQKTVEWAKQHPQFKCDLISVDGDHAGEGPKLDLVHMRSFALPRSAGGSRILIDDTSESCPDCVAGVRYAESQGWLHDLQCSLNDKVKNKGGPGGYWQKALCVGTFYGPEQEQDKDKDNHDKQQ